MGLRDIRKRLRKLCWGSLMGPVDKVPEGNQIFESGGHAAAREWKEYRVSERRLEVPCETKGHDAAALAFMQCKTEIAAGVGAQGKTQVCAGDIARGILGPDSGATISNVLVLGTEGSTPLKRMEIHFEDPKQVPSMLNLLAVALQSSGFDFRAVRNLGIPTTEIWLSTPLDDGKKTLLSCAAIVGEQVVERVAVQAGSPRNQTQ